MSDNIPFEIQLEIIKRVSSVKSLIRFRSVSKLWKSLIDTSDFITHQTISQSSPHHLLVAYDVHFRYKYVSIHDDHTFPHHKFVPTLPPSLNLVTRVLMVNSSHGLVCVYGHAPHISPRNSSIVVWNPSIRRSVCVVLPYGSDGVGFGVCPKTCDPIIVAITCPFENVGWKAQVFNLSSRVWRSVAVNLPVPVELVIKPVQVVTDAVIYLLANDSVYRRSEMIISFDLTTEEFGVVDLPDSLPHPRHMSMSKLNESLALLDYGYNCNEEVCDVWVMVRNGDVKPLFTKLFSVSFQAFGGIEPGDVIGFRKDGELIREYGYRSGSDGSVVTTLEAYEPSTGRRSDLGIVTTDSYCMMTSYTESLLLLNLSHSDSIIQL